MFKISVYKLLCLNVCAGTIQIYICSNMFYIVTHSYLGVGWFDGLSVNFFHISSHFMLSCVNSALTTNFSIQVLFLFQPTMFLKNYLCLPYSLFFVFELFLPYTFAWCDLTNPVEFLLLGVTGFPSQVSRISQFVHSYFIIYFP